MNEPRKCNRRTALRTVGAAVVAGTVMTGSASAGDWNDERRQDTFTWGQNSLHEMLASEGPGDNEGDEASHRPLWIIKSMAGTGEPGSDHSAHIHGVDHVVPLDGPSFTAQWHVHAVIEKGSTPHPSKLVRTDQNGDYLTSATRIRNATNVDIIDFDFVFTCPVRPHTHHP